MKERKKLKLNFMLKERKIKRQEKGKYFMNTFGLEKVVPIEGFGCGGCVLFILCDCEFIRKYRNADRFIQM